jgi:hypothetical protein
MGRKGKGISQVNPIIGRQVNRSHSLSRSLVHYYSLNEGGGQKAWNMIDNKSIILGQTSPAVSATFSQTTQGSAASFLSGGQPTNLQFTNATGFSISFWFTPLNTTTAVCLIAYTNSASNGWYLEYNAVGAGLLQFDMLDGAGANYHRVSSTTPLVVGNWYHIVITRNRLNNATTSSTMYINGVDVSARSNTSNPGTMSYASGQFCIGGRFVTGGANEILTGTGLIQNVMLWQNRTLTQTEVRQLYTNPYCILK